MTGHRIDLPEMPVGSKFTGEYIEGGVKIKFGKDKQRPILTDGTHIGLWYKCVRSVVMNASHKQEFEVEKFYLCEERNCLTNNSGDKNHEVYFGDGGFFKKYFGECLGYINKP